MIKNVIESLVIYFFTFLCIVEVSYLQQNVSPKLSYYNIYIKNLSFIASHLISIIIPLVIFIIKLLFSYNGVINILHNCSIEIKLKSIRKSTLRPIKDSIKCTSTSYGRIKDGEEDLFWEYKEFKLNNISNLISTNKVVSSEIESIRRLRVTDLAISLLNLFSKHFYSTETKLSELIRNDLIQNDENFRTKQIKKSKWWTNSKRILFIQKKDLNGLIENEDFKKFIFWHTFEEEFTKLRNRYCLKFHNKEFCLKKVKLKILVHNYEKPLPKTFINIDEFKKLKYLDFAFSSTFLGSATVFAQKGNNVILYDSRTGTVLDEYSKYQKWFEQIWDKSDIEHYKDAKFYLSKRINNYHEVINYLDYINSN